MRALAFALLLLLLAGCLGPSQPAVVEEGKKASTPPSEVVVEEGEGDVAVEEGDRPSGGKEVEGGIFFFDVHSTAPLKVELYGSTAGGIVPATSDRPKDGRLILIKSGREELVVWSVPEERYRDALQVLEEKVNFPIEYLLIPSGYPTSVETAFNATQDLDVEEVLVPAYDSKTIPVEGRELKAGDTLKVGDYSLEILSPIPGRLPGEEGNSITFQLSYGEERMLFLLDANPALVTVLYTEHRPLEGWLIELPQYGRGVGSYPIALNLFREYGAEAFIVEGAPLAEGTDPVEDRAIFNFIWDVLDKPIYAVWLSPVTVDLATHRLSGEVVEIE